MPGSPEPPALSGEATAQLAARLWLALQTEQLYHFSNQWACEYQDILLSLDIERNLRAKAIKNANAAMAIATGVFMAWGNVVANACLRGTGPLARLLLPRTAFQANVAAQATRTAAAEAALVAEHTAQMAMVNVGKQLYQPMWLMREFQFIGRFVGELPIRACFMTLSGLPVVLTKNWLDRKVGDNRPQAMGSARTLYKLATRDDLDKEERRALRRAEEIIAGYLSAFTDSQKALMCMAQDELVLAMAHIDADMCAQLRNDPRLRAERVDEKTMLFLRAQLLMDYWLGVQKWIELMRPRAVMELRQFLRQVR